MTIFMLILVILALSTTAFYIWGMKKIRKEKKKFRYFIAPFLINAISSFLMFYMLMILLVAIIHEMNIDIYSWITLTMPIIVQTVANQLLYFLYYKKKKILNGKEYALTSLAGALSLTVYIAYLEISSVIKILML